MNQSKRLANFELLRLLAMLMVVTMHYLAGMELLPELGKPVDSRQILGTVLESCCIVAVNVYVLISGYFMVQAEFRVSRVIRLICQVLFYTVLIPLVLCGLGIPVAGQQEGFYGLLQYILPVSTGHYWFVTEYVILYLFSPLLNAAYQKMSRRQLGLAVGLLLIMFCGIKSLMPVLLATDRFGYDFGWFLCLYLVGGYIKLYGLPFLEKGKRGWLIYAGSAAGVFLLTLGMHYLHETAGLFAYYFTVPFHYNFILCLLGAVGLFYGFSKIRIKEGKGASIIRKMGPLSLGVYLLHMHVDIRYHWYHWTNSLLGNLSEMGLPGLFLNIIATVLLVFLSGMVVDYIRSKIFEFAEKGLLKWKNSMQKS